MESKMPVAAPVSPSLRADLTYRHLDDDHKTLLDLLDSLQSSSLSHIPLPKIVVVGDQSAGKSSVLTSITGVHFPRDANACTRFPTEVRLRRVADDAGVTVQIVPGRTRTPAERQKLAEVQKLEGFGTIGPGDSVGFVSLLKKATALITSLGLSGTFAARDRLRIDCWGPDMGHMSFVDLPGFVKVSNKEQNDADRAAIDEIADEYLRSSRSVILAIVGGNVDYVQQTVLAKVKQFDPQGLRTLGVLTKPDMVKQINQEEKFLSLVNGAEKDFKLGWHVLLNGDKNVVWSPKERKDHEKKFFSQKGWRDIPEENWGADRLWERVSVQLSQHIARHIPKLLREIDKELKKCEADLEALGPGCDTPGEMKSQLSNLFAASQFIIDGAVTGKYLDNIEGPRFFPLMPSAKGPAIEHLRARVVKENKRFVQKMTTEGHTVNIIPGESEILGPVNGVLTGQVSKEEYIQTMVNPMLEQNTGLEQEGEYDPLLINKLFLLYSDKWEGLAEEHMTNVEVLCSAFLEKLINCAWPQRMRAPLRGHLLDKKIEQANKAAQEELRRLLKDQKLCIRVYDPEYIERVKAWKKEQATMTRIAPDGEAFLEKMLIYYDITFKTFISNVVAQVIERHLLQSLFKLFGSENLNNMSEEIVTAIIAEDAVSIQNRGELKKKKKDIEEQRKRCKIELLRKEIPMISSTDPDSSSDDSHGDGQGTTIRQRPTTPPAKTQAPIAQNRQYLPSLDAHSSYAHLSDAHSSPDQANATLTSDQASVRTLTRGTTSVTHTPKVSTPSSDPTHARTGSATAHATIRNDHSSVQIPGNWKADYNPNYHPYTATTAQNQNYAASRISTHLDESSEFVGVSTKERGHRAQVVGGDESMQSGYYPAYVDDDRTLGRANNEDKNKKKWMKRPGP